ncbi:3625_t:CDS:2, partial [Funneliformis geosporum]
NSTEYEWRNDTISKDKLIRDKLIRERVVSFGIVVKQTLT